MENREVISELDRLKYYEGVHALITADTVEAVERAEDIIEDYDMVKPYRTAKKIMAMDFDYGACPSCGNIFQNDGSYSYCKYCGQKLDWGDY